MNLVLRVAVAAVFVPLYILLMIKGGIGLLLVHICIVGAAVTEFCRLGRPSRDPEVVPTAVISAAVLYLMASGHPGEAASLAILPFLFVLGLGIAAGEPRNALFRASRATAAVLYVAWLFGHVHLLRNPSPRLLGWGIPPWKLALIPFCLTWLIDTAAYGVGRVAGRTRMAPVISPKKSWEGAAAGLAMGLLSGGIVAVLLHVPLAAGLVLGGFAGTVGQAGDLAESLLKREAGVKDSSCIIPGHGGVLDRFDSLLLNIPGIYYLLMLMAPGAH